MAIPAGVFATVTPKIAREAREGIFAIAHCDDGVIWHVIVRFSTMHAARVYGNVNAQNAVCKAFDAVANELSDQRRLPSSFNELMIAKDAERAAAWQELPGQNVWYPALPK